MQTSRFQLGLIATLAVCLGFALASSDAVGYPAGAVVSYGSNPVFAVGGSQSHSASTTVLTAPAGQRAVITDLVFTIGDTSGDCVSHMRVALSAGGVTVASLDTGIYRPAANFTGYSPVVALDLKSGIPVDPDEDLVLTTTLVYSYGCSPGVGAVQYTLSGYYAQP